jgi:hypothetical protein
LIFCDFFDREPFITIETIGCCPTCGADATGNCEIFNWIFHVCVAMWAQTIFSSVFIHGSKVLRKLGGVNHFFSICFRAILKSLVREIA